MASPFVVAWLDIGSRTGVCPRCILGPIARNPQAFDMKPADLAHAAGKGCAERGEALVGDAHDGAREEYVLEVVE